LVAVKLHSGRLTDARDPIALINDIDLDDVAIHNERGVTEQMRQILDDVEKTVSNSDFGDPSKGYPPPRPSRNTRYSAYNCSSIESRSNCRRNGADRHT
jgi:hypothetical protein